jgi:hypothetical protein
MAAMLCGCETFIDRDDRPLQIQSIRLIPDRPSELDGVIERKPLPASQWQEALELRLRPTDDLLDEIVESSNQHAWFFECAKAEPTSGTEITGSWDMSGIFAGDLGPYGIHKH